MLFELWISVFFFALFKGGRIQNLNSVRFRYPFVFVLCFLLYLLIFLLYDCSVIVADPSMVYQSVLLVLLVALSLNWHIYGFPLILIGFLLNLVAILANGGLMPVSYSGVINAQLMDHLPVLLQGDGKHAVMNEQTKLWFLGDLVPLPRPYGMKQVASIGDIVLSVGVAQFLYQALTTKQTS
jgi:prepilin signal peptidase PulO-like enzyme (type II secretory pathway)